MRKRIFPFVLLFLYAISPRAGSEELWRIGSLDAAYAEFAIAGAYQEYATAFPEDVGFAVGESNPAQDWPFIQPGPADAWAGSKSHAFKIVFPLEQIPSSGCRLLLALTSTQPASPPTVRVMVNGNACNPVQLPGGSSDEALTNPKAGKACRQAFLFPSSWLISGRNEIEIASTAGSWLLYDALKLESGVSDTPEIAGIEAVCTPFYKKVDDVLHQGVRVRVENEGLSGPGVLVLEGDALEQAVEIPLGTAFLTLLVPPFTREERRSVTLRVGDKEFSTEFEARPERQWTLYVAASAHTDIGYTDLQEKCMALHVDNAVAGMDAVTDHPDFVWNLEVFAQYDWFKELKPERASDLDALIKEGRIGLTALYLNMLTGLCNGAEMMRLLAPAQQCARTLGVSVEMASLNDVPTSVGTLPMFLRHAGVRYFAEAINEDRGPVFKHCDPEMNQSPFWWEAPDGSRVLAMFTRTYFQVWQIRLHESVAAVEETLPRFLDKFVRKDYPGDAIFINGAFLDNCAMTPHYADVIAEWNALWDYPRFVMAAPDAYFRHMEQHFGNELPVYRGDMGVFWEDGAASSAAETAMVRRAKNILSTAEKWDALAAAYGGDAAPCNGFAEAWKNILYYDEHTWGSAVSISDPENPQSKGQWTRKAAFAGKSLEQSRAIERECGLEAVRNLAGVSPAEKGRFITVSNPFSWVRDVPVCLPADMEGGSVRDKSNGKQMPAQRTADGELFFVAGAVPAMGWCTFELVASKPRGEALLRESGEANTWMTDRFSFHVNEQTGGLDRITDLNSGHEWVDPGSSYHLNQFLHVSGGERTAMIHPNHAPATDLAVSTHESATVTVVENGPARAVLHIARTGGTSPVDTEMIVHRDGVFDFINLIHKIETLDKEAGYFAYPFGLNAHDGVTAYMELPYGVIAADQEQMPGACREWYAVNTFAAVGNGEQSACLAACDTPLFTIGDINRGTWPNRLKGNRHQLFAYVYNNYWHTNYKASQGGDLRCAFSLKLSESRFDAADATRFGWGRTLDLTPESRNFICSQKMQGPARQSLFRLEEGPVLLGELVRLESGKTLARLYNPSASAAQTSLLLNKIPVTEMRLTDLFGEKEMSLPVNEKITVPARGIATVTFQTRKDT